MDVKGLSDWYLATVLRDEPNQGTKGFIVGTPGEVALLADKDIKLTTMTNIVAKATTTVVNGMLDHPSIKALK